MSELLAIQYVSTSAIGGCCVHCQGTTLNIRTDWWVWPISFWACEHIRIISCCVKRGGVGVGGHCNCPMSNKAVNLRTIAHSAWFLAIRNLRRAGMSRRGPSGTDELGKRAFPAGPWLSPITLPTCLPGERGSKAKGEKGGTSEGAPAPWSNAPVLGVHTHTLTHICPHPYTQTNSHTHSLTCQAWPEQYLCPADKQKALKHKHPPLLANSQTERISEKHVFIYANKKNSNCRSL